MLLCATKRFLPLSGAVCPSARPVLAQLPVLDRCRGRDVRASSVLGMGAWIHPRMLFSVSLLAVAPITAPCNRPRLSLDLPPRVQERHAPACGGPLQL